MENIIVQATKTIIIALFASIIFANTASQADNNDISQYYGFGEMEIIKLDWDIKALIVADFNGDKRNDIAVANNRKAKIELLIQKENFGPAETDATVDPEDIDVNLINPPTRFNRQSIAVSQKMFSLVHGDLNSDGMTDLAFYGEPKGLYVQLQKTNDSELNKKTLNWQTRKKIKIDDALLTQDVLVCADLNNDGKDDLALAARKTTYIILQKPDGSLAEPVKYPTTSLTRAIYVTDLNGDKINDLILLANDKEKPIHVRFGLKTGQLGPQVQFFIEKPWILEFADIDNTPGTEILTVDNRSGRLIAYKFSAEKQQENDWPILFYPLASGEGKTKRDLAVADFNGDKLDDVVISDPAAAEFIFYKQTPLGLAEPVRFPALSNITNISVADIDKSNNPQIGVLSVSEKIIGISKFENDRLSFPKPIDLTGEPLAMELEDLDRDGNIDCIYISKDANDIRSMKVIYNLSATDKVESANKKQTRIRKKFGEAEPALELKNLTTNPDGLKVLDVDQDGMQDVLIFVKYELPILIRQTQKRKFEAADSSKIKASLVKNATPYSTFAANIDEKSGNELLIAQNNFARSLAFSKNQGWNIIDQYNAKSTENKISAVAAFNLDNKNSKSNPAILLLDGQKGQLQILKTGSDKIYRFEKELDVGKFNTVNHLKMLFAPLTGDDTKSILLFDSEKFALVTPPGTNNIPQQLEQHFSYETKIKDGTYGNIISGDINSDNQLDIIMVEFARNHFEILTLNSDSKPIPAMRFKIFEEKTYRNEKRSKANVEPRQLKIADVTGDAKADLVTLIHDRIIIYPQD